MSRITGSAAFAVGCSISCVFVACGADPLSRLQPELQVSPLRVDFEQGCIGIDNEVPLTLRNVGQGELFVESTSVEGRPIFDVGDVPVSVPPGEERSLTAIFRPAEAGVRYESTLVLITNDPTTPEWTVPLVGQGGLPRLAVAPSELDFGVVDEGASRDRAVEIANPGGAPLTIVDLAWTSASGDLVPLDWPSVPFVLPAKTATAVRVRYDPAGLGTDTGVVTVRSDEPDTPQIDVPVRAAANLAPRAVAWACPATPGEVGCPEAQRQRNLAVGLGQNLRLDGQSSFDPEGAALQYEWSVVERPDDSRASVFHSTEDRARDNSTGEFQADRVGRYELRLQVTDLRGLTSAVREESVIVLRPKDLEIRLTWDVDTDVDLHFIRPGGQLRDYGTGAAGTSTGSDCSPFNRAPDWGVPGDPSDDPRLDRDDVGGQGPEIVSIDRPQTDAPYTVYAHYCDSSDLGIPVNVAFDIRVRGMSIGAVPAMGDMRLLPGEVWAAAEVVWRADQAEVRRLDRPVALRPDLCRSR